MPDHSDHHDPNTDGPTLRERFEKLLAPGTRVGDYVVDIPLGEGGFATVYRATHPLIGKRAAVKVLNKDLSADRDVVARFVAEARAVNTIRHQNIVDIFNIGTLDDGRHYFVMELLEGQSFEEMLAERTRIEPEELLAVMRGVSEALQAAHDKGIVHRDLKPDNIFLHREPSGGITPKLVDFGVAKLTGEAKGLSHHQTTTGAPIGTPRYMSPEQCFGKDVDVPTDIYAFGVVCFEALTGYAPFEADSLLSLMNMHTLAPRPNASERCPSLGTAFDEPLKRMLSIDMLERPQSAREAFALLESAVRSARGLRRGADTPTALNVMPGAPPAPVPRAPVSASALESGRFPQHTTPIIGQTVGLAPAITKAVPATTGAWGPASRSGAYAPASQSGAYPQASESGAWGTLQAGAPGHAEALALAARKPNTLGATTRPGSKPPQRSSRWVVLALLAFGVVGVGGLVLVTSLSSGTSSETRAVPTDPRPSEERPSDPRPAGLGASEPTSDPVVDLDEPAPSAAPSASTTSSAPLASGSSVTAPRPAPVLPTPSPRRRAAPPPPPPAPAPASGKKPDPYSFQ